MYVPPILAFWISFIFGYVYLAHMVSNPVTQILCFSIPFHLYIHDHHSNQAGCRLSWVSNICVSLILAFWIKVLYSVTFI